MRKKNLWRNDGKTSKMPILRQQNTIQVKIRNNKGQSNMTLPKEAQENVQRLQMLEQNLQALNMQKQQFQAQMFEIEGALKEVETTNAAYKIVGGIMVGTDKTTLQKELQSKKEILELRLQTLDKQEKQLKEKAKKIQEEVMASVK